MNNSTIAKRIVAAIFTCLVTITIQAVATEDVEDVNTPDLSNNHLQALPEQVGNLPQLEKRDPSGNALQSLSQLTQEIGPEIIQESIKTFTYDLLDKASWATTGGVITYVVFSGIKQLLSR